MFAALPLILLSVGAFGPGEQTSYEVSWLGLTAGVAQVTVAQPRNYEGHTVWPIVCVGKTTSLGAIYPINDRFISWWDPSEGRPVGADFTVREHHFHQNDRYAYDRDAGQAVVTRHREGKEPYELRFDMPGHDTMDLASAAFSLRSTPLKVGEEHVVPIFTGVRVYRMTAKVVNKEPIDTALGRLDVFRVTVNGDFDGKLSTKGLMTIFYTADERQLPVRGEADFLLGTVLLQVTSSVPGAVP